VLLSVKLSVEMKSAWAGAANSALVAVAPKIAATASAKLGLRRVIGQSPFWLIVAGSDLPARSLPKEATPFTRAITGLPLTAASANEEARNVPTRVYKSLGGTQH
jgi:hypothetical protein